MSFQNPNIIGRLSIGVDKWTVPFPEPPTDSNIEQWMDNMLKRLKRIYPNVAFGHSGPAAPEAVFVADISNYPLNKISILFQGFYTEMTRFFYPSGSGVDIEGLEGHVPYWKEE